MRRLIILCLLLTALPLVLPASEFDWMVREFSRRSGVPQTHVPFFGIARFAVAITRPAGASDLKLAIFESTKIRAAQFSQLFDSIIGTNGRPMIRVRSKTGEITNVYVQADGKHLRLFVATLDGNQATLVELRLKPDSLFRVVDDYRSHAANP